MSVFVFICIFAFRTQAEMAHTCRGTITLATVHIEVGDTCHFVLTSGGRSYHLKAGSEGECQRWVSALQQAKANATQMMHHSGEICTYSIILLLLLLKDTVCVEYTNTVCKFFVSFSSHQIYLIINKINSK